jgi:starch synthase
MKALLAASEVAPIIKIGGLGDVIGSLPKALEKIGVNEDVIVPFYPSAKTEKLNIYKNFEMEVPFNGASHAVEVFSTKLPNSNVNVFLLKNAHYFATGGTNFFANNISETEMYSFFCRSVVEYIKARFNNYDIVHCNDWHTGLITHLLQDELGAERPATLFTIHNLMYQGIGDPAILKEIGIVPGAHPLIDWDISDGDINFMQQGITASDFINAVSPTYAQEILTPEFGGQFCEILEARKARLTGILNGIDYSQFPRDFDLSNCKNAKQQHKTELKKLLGLSEVSDKPIFSFVGRIDPNQKGMDIMYEAIPEIVKGGGQFVLLGKGLPEWEEKLNKLSEQKELSADVSINLKFDVDLANKLYAATDYLVVPSRYEPCGLIQMIGMWYGAVPVVHAVGGLKDTVKDGFNGYVFNEYTSQALNESITRALKAYKAKESDVFVENALKEDFSWDKSAVEYMELYEKVIKLG